MTIKMKTLAALEYGPLMLRSNNSTATKVVEKVTDFLTFLEREKSVTFELHHDYTITVNRYGDYVEWCKIDSTTGEVVEINLFIR